VTEKIEHDTEAVIGLAKGRTGMTSERTKMVRRKRRRSYVIIPERGRVGGTGVSPQITRGEELRRKMDHPKRVDGRTGTEMARKRRNESNENEAPVPAAAWN